MSIEKHTLTENKSAGLESPWHASRRRNSLQIFQRSSADFAGIVRSRIHRKRVEKLCKANRGANREGPSCPAQVMGTTGTPLGQRESLYFFCFSLFSFERTSGSMW